MRQRDKHKKLTLYFISIQISTESSIGMDQKRERGKINIIQMRQTPKPKKLTTYSMNPNYHKRYIVGQDEREEHHTHETKSQIKETHILLH